MANQVPDKTEEAQCVGDARWSGISSSGTAHGRAKLPAADQDISVLHVHVTVPKRIHEQKKLSSKPKQVRAVYGRLGDENLHRWRLGETKASEI